MTLKIQGPLERLPQEIIQHRICKYLPMKDCAMLTYVSTAFSRLLTDPFLQTRASDLHFVMQAKGDESVAQTFKRLFPIIRSLNKPAPTTYFIPGLPSHEEPLPSWLKKVVAEDQSGLLKDFIDGSLTSIDSADANKVALATHLITNRLLSTLFVQATSQGSLRCVEVIITSDMFNKIPVISLGKGFRRAFKRGHTHCAKALIACSRINQVLSFEFNWSIVYAAQHGHVEFLKLVIASSRFNQIPADKLGWSLVKATEHGHAAYVEALIACSRFHEVGTFNLEWSFRNAAEKGFTDCLKALIGCSRLNELSKLGLAEIFRKIVKGGHVDCLKLLMACPRFSELSGKPLAWGICYAAWAGYTGCVKALMACPQFKEVSANRVGQALFYAVKNKHTDCVKALIGCPQVKNVPEKVVEKIFSTAECLKILVESALFNQMGFFNRFHYLRIYISTYQASSAFPHRHSPLFLFLHYLHCFECWFKESIIVKSFRPQGN